MKILYGQDNTIRDLLVVAEEFALESNQPVNYSEYNSTRYFTGILNDPSTDIISVTVDDDLAGVALVGYEADFHVERFGYLIKFYVCPKYRGTKVGRLLTNEVSEWFDSNDCVKSFATATAGIQADQAFINLLGKYGFLPEGTVLIRNRHV